MNRRAYTINEFGPAYGPKRSLTYKLLNEGKLKAVKVGKKRLILADDAEAWLASLKSNPTQLAA
jgi:excisionase family DNA binding protein